jgi:hypothetical protein
LPIYSINQMGYIGLMSSQTSTPAPTDAVSTDGLRLPQALLHELREALRAIRYGTIELVIHDGRVVQLERREKVRFDVGLTDQKR